MYCDPSAEFVMKSITREQIAINANEVARQKNLRIEPFVRHDERLTDEVCHRLASDLPLDFGDPAAHFQEECYYLEMMRDVGALTDSQLKELDLPEVAPTPSVPLSESQD